ncbi:Icc-related predicted phosphoesterase [Allocatelliglobosispora scoriae]|uniref:Icc-related predicted phosphoesterase n=1 Tax=Allocatelliglobosispora scoriae TaxID=643052 RepID=A0A841BLP6_9ACTN|nr:metallophosphoesterase [Allocatelliglobosispora scoriae]MBB5867672.1 Icc-related predicted phosphoesterase [Allocatelliglobosispora scoriae]
MTVRIAAVGDVHMDTDVLGRYRAALEELPDLADVLLLAGDLTRHGTVEETECVTKEFGELGIPVIAVLGNHDHHSDSGDLVTKVLTDAGITVLEGDSVEIDCRGVTVGVAGVKGFGGGFAGKCASAFGEREMKNFVRTTEESADRLRGALRSLRSDVIIALTHYAPIPETLMGEPPEIYPFLGSYLLGEAIDAAPTALAVHGHAHAGKASGRTPGGIRVRNVAQPVLRQAYAVFHLDDDRHALAVP